MPICSETAPTTKPARLVFRLLTGAAVLSIPILAVAVFAYRSATASTLPIDREDTLSSYGMFGLSDPAVNKSTVPTLKGDANATEQLKAWDYSGSRIPSPNPFPQY